MAIDLKKTFILILKFTVMGILIFFVIKKINFPEFLLVLKRSNILLLVIATTFFTLSKLVSSVRLNLFLGTIGVSLPEKYNMKLYWLGMYYNLFLPGGIGGDGYKVYLLNREFKTGTKKIAAAILIDRVTGMMALFSLLVFLTYFVAFPTIFKYFIWVLIPASVWIFYITIRNFFPDFLSVFHNTNLLSFGV